MQSARACQNEKEEEEAEERSVEWEALSEYEYLQGNVNLKKATCSAMKNYAIQKHSIF